MAKIIQFPKKPVNLNRFVEGQIELNKSLEEKRKSLLPRGHMQDHEPPGAA